MGRYLELAPISPKRDRARNARDNCLARQDKSQELSIETNPAGASIGFNNSKSPIVGSTPLKLRLPPGVQRVFIEKPGYETVIRDIELKRGTPLRLSIDLRELNAKGYLFVDSSISGATVFLNGESKRLTPFDRAIALKKGIYQLHLKTIGYASWTRQIEIEALTVHHVPARLQPLEKGTTWRTPTGWVTQVVGALCIAGGYIAMRYANNYYNDTSEFERLAQAERLGYGVGGGLMGLGLSLVVYDWFNDPFVDRDRNPAFGASRHQCLMTQLVSRHWRMGNERSSCNSKVYAECDRSLDGVFSRKDASEATETIYVGGTSQFQLGNDAFAPCERFKYKDGRLSLPTRQLRLSV